MIDVFVGGLLAGASLTGTICAIVHHCRKPKPAPQRANAIALPPLGEAPTVFNLDGHPLQREDLTAVAWLLHTRAHVWMNQAYNTVLAQVAHDEASAGVDDVEDAANGRWSA